MYHNCWFIDQVHFVHSFLIFPFPVRTRSINIITICCSGRIRENPKPDIPFSYNIKTVTSSGNNCEIFSPTLTRVGREKFSIKNKANGGCGGRPTYIHFLPSVNLLLGRRRRRRRREYSVTGNNFYQMKTNISQLIRTWVVAV